MNVMLLLLLFSSCVLLHLFHLPYLFLWLTQFFILRFVNHVFIMSSSCIC